MVRCLEKSSTAVCRSRSFFPAAAGIAPDSSVLTSTCERMELGGAAAMPPSGLARRYRRIGGHQR